MSQQVESVVGLSQSTPIPGDFKLEPSEIPIIPDLTTPDTNKNKQASEIDDEHVKVINPVNEASWRRASADQEASSYRSNHNSNNYNTNKGYAGQKSKRYTKTSHTKTSHAFGGQKGAEKAGSLAANSAGSTEVAVLSHTNSVQCLREVHVPLVQYEKEGGELGQQTSDSDVSDSGSNMSNMYLAKCTAKVRIAAFGVLLTAFQVIRKQNKHAVDVTTCLQGKITKIMAFLDY